MAEAWFPIVSAPQEVDLTEISAALWKHQIPHRIVQEAEGQVIFGARENQERIVQVIQAWERGELQQLETPKAPFPQWLRILLLPPVVLSLIVLSVLGYLLGVEILPGEWGGPFYFQVYGHIGKHTYIDSSVLPWTSGEWWRLVTPIFLHFSLMHVAFNCLWLWEFGRKIERYENGLYLLFLVIFIGIFSNLAQYVHTPNNPFGGMSGVVYGLLGYLWLRCKLAPVPELALPPALVGILLFFLALGFTGGMDVLAGGAIANAAHLGGFVAGGLLGIVDGFRFKGGAGRV
ncbi:MAG: rhomboid family intramembrane serine protease [Cellvibrionaceae bacterium]